MVQVQHYNADGSPWFVEHYTWQGREGLKQQRRVNALGEPLLDDGSVALKVVKKGPPEEVTWLLSDGHQWGYNARPRLSEASILGVIQATHKERLASGWPQGMVDRLGSFKHSVDDDTGCTTLATFFAALKGRSV